MVWTFWPQTEAGPIIEPEPASLRLLLRNLQPLLPRNPLDPLHVHNPACGSQQGHDPPMTIVVSSARELVHLLTRRTALTMLLPRTFSGSICPSFMTMPSGFSWPPSHLLASDLRGRSTPVVE